MDIKKNVRGVISIEASIVVPLFILAFIVIFSTFNIIKTQVYLQNACNQMAKEISEQSYIFRKVDLNRIAESKLLDGIEITNANITKKIFSSAFNNKALKIKAKKYLFADRTDDCLRKLGVVDGLDGLKFISTDSLDEEGQITIVLKYSMENKFGIFHRRDYNFVLLSSTIALASSLDKYDIRSEIIGYKNDDNIFGEANNVDRVNIWDISPHKRTNGFKDIIEKESLYKRTDDRYGLDFYDDNKDELIYLHSMNTVCKSYIQEDKLKEKNISKKFEDYLHSMLKDASSRKEITIDGKSKKIDCRKCKMIIILNEETIQYKKDYQRIVDNIIRSNRSSKIRCKIELIFSDGEIDR